MKFTEDLGKYIFTVNLPKEIDLSIEDSMKTTVECKYTSKEEYPYIVPTSAVVFEDNGNGHGGMGYIYSIMTRQRVYGEEYYVVPLYVEIDRIIGNEVSLANLIGDIDISFTTSKPLENEMAIRLKL